LLPLLLLAGALPGFYIETEEAKKERKDICAFIRESIGTKEMNRFIKETIRSQEQVGGIDLAESKIGKDWICIGNPSNWLLRSGDWQFTLEYQTETIDDMTTFQLSDTFSMLWHYKDGMGIWVEGTITEENTLKLKSIVKGEVIVLSA